MSPPPSSPSDENGPLDDFLLRLPKAELHLHLEGSLAPAELQELARRNRLPTAEWPVAEFEKVYRYKDLRGFLRAYKFVTEHLKTPADYEWLTTRLAEKLHRQNVSYAEVNLSAGVLHFYRLPVEAFFEAAARGAETAARDFNIQFNWIFDAVRQFGDEPAREVMRIAARYREQGVVAFGIGGDELQGPPKLFEAVYREARDAGLHLVAHAGETGGPQSVRDAVEILGAERIGHGVGAASDPALLDLLAELQITVEVCLSSNLATGVVNRLEDHPLPRLLGAGIPVTLNTDDPAMFHTDLIREYRLAAETFGLSRERLEGLAEQSFRSAFGKVRPPGGGD